MTELEEKFFETFGIKRKNRQYCNNGYCNRKPATKKFADDEICRNCNHGIFYKVPEITDHILLELVCILVKYDFYNHHIISAQNITELRKQILKDCIMINKRIKDSVLKLFEE